MSATGVPIYTSAPLNSNKSEGTHTTTSHPEPATAIQASTTSSPQSAAATTTATAPSYAPVYATAEPGAAPGLPAPTTIIPSAQSPPNPLPGAVPSLSQTAPRSTIAPPPKVGETAVAGPFMSSSYAYQRPSHSHPPNSTSTPYSAVYQSAADVRGPSQHQAFGGYPASGGGAADIFDSEPGFMTTARSWMQSAGSKLANAEAEAWKFINNAHDEK